MNQNEPTPNIQRETSNADNSRSTASTEAENIKQKNTGEEKEVAAHSLNKALIRTFRSDVVTRFGGKIPTKFQLLLPKKKLPVQKNKVQPSVIRQKPRNEAVVHTLGDDVQNLVRNKKMSMVHMAALETRETRAAVMDNHSTKDPWRITLFVTLLLLALTIGTVIVAGSWYVYQRSIKENFVKTTATLLFTEKKQQLDVTNKAPGSVVTMLASIQQGFNLAPGSITEIILTKTPKAVSIREVLQPTQITAKTMLRTIYPKSETTFLDTLLRPYLFGFYTTNTTNIPVFVFKVNSYSYAFSGMLGWESTILMNLNTLFNPTQETPSPTGFTDTVVNNLDARILHSTKGSVLIVYSFINKDTLVITGSVRTLIEVVSRLQIQK